jgi:acetoin utilization protein AcuB
MLMPTVDRYMTREPYRVASTDTLELVKKLMHEHDIRHLPVVDGGRLVGIISERDLDVVEAVPGTHLCHVEVARVMAPPIDVWAETPIDQVSALMAEKKRDCVVVQGGQGVEGVFTATDALLALTDLVRRATT